MTQRWRLQLLGRFGIASGTAPEIAVRLPNGRPRALVAYLAMRPGFAETRERLATLFWGDNPDRQARQSLRQCLLVLKKESAPLGFDLINVGREDVALAPHCEVDAVELLKAASAPFTDLDSAAALFKGDFLDGTDLDIPAFERWVRAIRIETRDAAETLFERHALSCDASLDGPKAIALAERWVGLDATNEKAQRHLLRLKWRLFGPEAASRQAQEVVRLIREELGAGPQPETASLISDIASSALQASGETDRGPPDLVPREIARIEHQGEPKIAEPGLPHAGRRILRRRAVMGFVTGAVSCTILVGWIMGPESDAPPVASASLHRLTPIANDWRPPKLVTSAIEALANGAVYPIVVLPFATSAVAGSPEARAADALTLDLINDLSRSPNARVISFQTSRLYAGRALDVATVGSELGVRYAVEGSVHRDEKTVRVNVALTDVTTRLQVWADRFERPAAEEPALREDITRAITRRLQITIVAMEDRSRPPSFTNRVPGISDRLANGWAAATRMSFADRTTGSNRYFEDVLERDPNNVSALTGLAAHHVISIAMFLEKDDGVVLDRAEKLLLQAIALNPNASLAHYYLGVLEKTRARPEAALSAFTKVLQLNPSYAPAYGQIGHVLSRIGRLEEALDHVRYAIRLSPKDHNLGLWRLFGGQIELELGNDQSAIDWLTQAVDAAPNSPFIQASLAAAFAVRNDLAQASRHAAEARRIAPWLSMKIMHERLVGLSRPGSEPRRLIEGLNKAFNSPGF